MTDINAMANVPIDVTINGRVLKARRLSLESIYATFEALIISKKIAEAQEIASGLTPDERIKFLMEIHRELPSGSVLQEMVGDQIGTISGVRTILLDACKQDQPELTMDDISGLVTEDNMDDLAGLVGWLCGVSDSPEPEKKTAKGRKKKKS